MLQLEKAQQLLKLILFFYCWAVRLAKLTTDKIVTATAGTSVLYPKTGGNLHCFTAITPCAVLDILSPPYREDAGRKCSYYHDYPYFTFCKFIPFVCIEVQE